MVDALVYAYPWDFEGDLGAVERAAGLGVGGVAVAASYHATRAARPMHPGSPFVDVEHAACYVPVRTSAWTGRRLVPKEPTWVSSADSFGVARQRIHDAGLQAHAWVVLTHNSALGGAHPELVVRNAFGSPYSYALCPSSQDVVEYCETLVDEILLAGPVSGLVLEACGQMGLEHNGLHEKTSLAGWSRTQYELLSLCFCAACTVRYVAEGLDVEHVRGLVRRGIGTASDSVEQALGAEVSSSLHAVRSGVTAHLRSLLTRLVRERHPGVRVALHAAPGRWDTGSFATVAPTLAAPVDALVASCFEHGHAADALAALHGCSGGSARLAALVRPTAEWAEAGVREELMVGYRSAGVDELHLYHLGLVGPDGLQLLGKMHEAFQRAS